MEPRVQPLPPEEWDDFTKANPYNVFATPAHHRMPALALRTFRVAIEE